MSKRDNKDDCHAERNRDGRDVDGGHLPYPDTDLSPALQRTIKRKLDAGEDEAVDREAFERAVRQATRQRGG